MAILADSGAKPKYKTKCRTVAPDADTDVISARPALRAMAEERRARQQEATAKRLAPSPATARHHARATRPQASGRFSTFRTRSTGTGSRTPSIGGAPFTSPTRSAGSRSPGGRTRRASASCFTGSWRGPSRGRCCGGSRRS